jgi:uncharacterized protein
VTTPTSNRYLQQLEAHQIELLGLGVRRVGLFGSCLRGEERSDSDVDVLVEFAPERKSLGALVDLADFLESLFERHVDLVTLESLSPYIGPHILSEVQYAQIAA